jgi:hypothetical protein
LEMTPQEEKELLLRLVVKVATMQLAEGGITPFGATLGSRRNVKLLLSKNWKREVTTQDDFEKYWIRELRQAAAAEVCRMACACADVRVPMEDGRLVPAVLIHVEHTEGSAEDVVYPYRRDDESMVVFGEPTSAETACQIFNTNESS